MSVTSISRYVGRAVDCCPAHGSPHRGVIMKATWNTFMDPVVVVHPDEHDCCGADLVLVGRDAHDVLTTLRRSDSDGEAV